MGSNERGGNENPVEGSTGGVASTKRSVSREILLAKTEWSKRVFITKVKGTFFGMSEYWMELDWTQ